MKTRYAFEFCDHPKTPDSIRRTLLEILECCNREFRPYYREVADGCVELCREHDLDRVIELGAGTAPISRQLAEHKRADGLTIVPSDLYPELDAWEKLQRRFPDRVEPIEEPVDFMQVREWPPKSLLVLVAAFHHIRPEDRPQLIRTLATGADRVAVFEPIRKNVYCLVMAVLSLIPALLLPLWFLRHPGRLRRVLWCWLLPVAPLMFLWDGWVSCLRQWSPEEWKTHLTEQLGENGSYTIDADRHDLVATWSLNSESKSSTAETREPDSVSSV